jgi:hypothetical protein
MKRWLAFALVALAATASQALPVEISAEYKLVSAGITIGIVTENFRREGDTYTLRSTTRSEGPLKLVLDDNITLRSRGRITPDGLQPMEFEQKRAGDASRDIYASFDWERGVMHSRYKGESREVALPPATQDRVSVMYQFMTRGKATPTVEMNMSNGRKVDRYTYRLVEQVRLATPAGEFDTVHYERVTATAKESKAGLWLARDRFNLPVRVVFDDPKGLKLEQVLLQLQVR